MLRTVHATGNSIEIEASFNRSTFCGTIEIFEEKRGSVPGGSLFHVKITAAGGVEIGVFEVGRDQDDNAVGITTLRLR